MGGCSYNYKCDYDYDDDDQCYMDEAYGTNTDEGFCYDGECRRKRTIGEKCKNKGGNYDNNYCVTGHCDSEYGVCRVNNDNWGDRDIFGDCTQYLNHLEMDPSTDDDHFLYNCEGDCDSDDDCSDKIAKSVCFQRAKHNSAQPPGCAGTPYLDRDYCVYESEMSSVSTGNRNPILHEPDAMPMERVYGKDGDFEVKVLFPGPEYAVALIAVFALLCFMWTVMVRRYRSKPQFQVVRQCGDSQEEDNCL